jgi:hypothetical protein
LTKDLDLSIREIDDLLQHLYLKLRGKKEGLSLAEPASILLSQLKTANPSFYAPQLTRFTPIIMDTLISGAYISFGFEGLQRLNNVAGDIAIATGDYIPAGVEEGLSKIRNEIESISAILKGDSPGTGPMADVTGKSETGTGGFFRESAWGTVGLPLVSTYNTGKTPFSTGRVVKARIEIRITGEWSVRKKHDPAVTFDHISAEPNSTFESQIRTAIKVAEKYAASYMGMKGIVRVPREYRISLPEIASFPASAIQRLSGGSAGLAIAALLISILSSLDLYRQRSKFDAGTSFTGKVDENGKVLAVEDSHIADKVRAVFFSRFSKLILPAGNYETAKKELAVLSGEYPSRKLDLVPAPDVAGIFRDSNLTETSKTPTGKPLLQRLFFWRKHLFTAGSLAALIFISMLIARPYLRRDIARVTGEGSGISITNRFGRLITEYPLNFKIVVGRNDKYRIFIDDFDGNGENEALCVYTDAGVYNSSSPHNRLIFISFDNKGRFRFRSNFECQEFLEDEIVPEERRFPIHLSKFSRFYRDSSGKSRFLAIANHTSHRPLAIINLSMEDFSKQTFYHQGNLGQMAFVDTDNDKVEDIVLSGYNNILGCCVIVVLDPKRMQGTSPQGANYNIPGFDDIAKYYVRLPDFYRYIPFQGSDWLPMITKVKNSKAGLVVTVHNTGNNVNFFLAENLKCVRAEVLQSGAEKSASSSVKITPFNYPNKQIDEAELRTGVRYWDGEEWVASPTANRSYLTAGNVSIDSTIAHVDQENEALILKNKRGITIKRHDLGFRTPGNSPYFRTFFGDFLEEEGNEVVAAVYNSRYLQTDGPDLNKLFVFVFSEKGRMLRRHVYDEASIVGDEMSRTAMKTSLQMLASSSLFNERLGPGYLYIGTHHITEPPAAIVKLSLEDGTHKEFFHKGFIKEMIPRDVDGDGRSELLLTGYNILLDAIVIIALDPDHIGGSSPKGACYNIPGRNRDIAKYYIRLPSYHRFEKFSSRFHPLRINILENSDRLRFLVRSRTESVVYTIIDDMIIVSAEVVLAKKPPGSSFVLSRENFPGKDAEEKGLLEGVRFWDGGTWTAAPTVNRSYLKHVAGDGR